MPMNRVLIIENEDIGNHFKALLEKSVEKVAVSWVKTKKDAFQILQQENIKVIVFDQRLDNNELGINIMADIKQQYPSIVGIMLSAYSPPNNTTTAIKHGIMYEYVNKQDITGLPGKVVDALRYYDIQHLMNAKKSKESVGIVNKKFCLRNLLHPIKLYIIGKLLLDDKYVFKDSWEQLYIINAGEEQCHKKSIEITKKVKVESTSTIENDVAIDVDAIKELLSANYNNQVSISVQDSTEHSTHEIEEVVKTYKMPAIPQSVAEDYLTTTILEGAQVFKKFQVTVVQECSICGESVPRSFYVYMPTSNRKLRKINTYKSGKQEIIEVSPRS